MKLCANCGWYFPNRYADDGLCLCPDVNKDEEPVAEDCRTARGNEELCGKEARYYQAKQS